MLILVASAFATQVSLDADTRRLQVGESTRLRVVVVAGSPDYTPDLPEVDGLRFTYIGSRPGRVSIDFKTERLVTYTWEVTALREGTSVVGPVPISVRDEALSTNTLSFTISPKVSDTDGVLVSTLVDEAWVGQVVQHDLSFRTTERVVDTSWTLPTYEGALIEPSVRAQNRSYTTVADGQTVQVVELATPVRLTREGPLEVTSTILTVQIPVETQRSRPKFGRGLFTEVRSELFTSDHELLVVKPLPEGKSEAWTGLVGQFEVESYLTDSTIDLGDSTTRVVRLSGTGTLAGFELSPVEADGFRSYADDPELEAELRDTGFWNRLSFREAVVPERDGELVLPERVLQFFDPVQGAYVTLVVPEERIQVSPGDPASSALETYSAGRADRRDEVDALAEDILPIHADAGGSDLPSPWFALGLLPGFVALVRQLRPAAKDDDPRVALRRRLARDMSLGELELVFRDCLGVALDLPAAGIERGDLEALGEDVRAECVALYADLEAARYGGATVADLTPRVRDLGGRLCS
jgi:hypothetical protein